MKKNILLILLAFMFSFTGNARNQYASNKTNILIINNEIINPLLVKENVSISSINFEREISKTLFINNNSTSDICGLIATLVGEVLLKLDFDEQTVLYIVLVVNQVCKGML